MSQQTHKFNLIDLLIVLFVLAMATALLLPAGNKPHRSPAQDFANLRQLELGMSIYSSDYRGNLPWPNWDHGKPMPNGVCRPGWLYTIDATSQPTFNRTNGLLWQYVRNPNAYVCPLDNPQALMPDGKGNRVARPQQLSSYILNGAIIGFRSGYESNVEPYKVNDMLPGDCTFFEGDSSAAWHFNDGAGWPAEGLSAKHLRGAVGFIDCHAEMRDTKRWALDSQTNGRNYQWCNPKAPDGGDPILGHKIVEE